MNVLIVYLSFYGNTANIAEKIAEAIGENATVRFIEDVSNREIAEADLVILGSPTHKYYEPSDMREFLDGLPEESIRGKYFCVFDTRFNQPISKQGSAALEISRRIKRRGGILFFPTESFFVEEREGPLEDGQEEKAEKWGHSILDEWKSNTKE
jgi:flavodoxin